MESKLHTNQIKLLNYLKTIKNLDGLSYWEIARKSGLNNAQTVKHHLSQLEKNGYLRRNLSNPSIFQILKDPIQDIVYINLYGFASCGNQSEFISEGNLESKIAVSTKLFGISNINDTFAVRANGDSMMPDIMHNDLVIFQKQSDIDTGRIGLVIDDGIPKIKQVVRDKKKKIILRSTNRSHVDKIIEEGSDFCVVGLAKGIIHSL